MNRMHESYLYLVFLFQHERRVLRPILRFTGIMLAAALTVTVAANWWVTAWNTGTVLLLVSVWVLMWRYLFTTAVRLSFPRAFYQAKMICEDRHFVSWADFFMRNG